MKVASTALLGFFWCVLGVVGFFLVKLIPVGGVFFSERYTIADDGLYYPLMSITKVETSGIL